MLEICGTEIYLTRGDSAAIAVELTDEISGETYEMQSGDRLILTVRKYHSRESPVLVERMLTGSTTFRLAPDDTAGLAFGTYEYDVELRTGNDVYTVVPCSVFKLLPEVTMP